MPRDKQTPYNRVSVFFRPLGVESKAGGVALFKGIDDIFKFSLRQSRIRQRSRMICRALFLKSSDGGIPTILGPTRELFLAFVRGHDQGKAVVCGKAGFPESVAQVGNDPVVVGIVSGFIGQ